MLMAWPSADCDGQKGQRIIFRGRRSIATATDDYREKSPIRLFSRGYLDDIIMPRNSRRRIIRALNMLKDKVLTNPPRKHDNLPL